MFQPVFNSNCPFSTNFVDTIFSRKSLTYAIHGVEFAAMEYNHIHSYGETHPNFISFKNLEIFDEPDEYGCVAYISFRVGEEPFAPSWLVAIMKYE